MIEKTYKYSRYQQIVNKSRQENSDAPGIKAYIIFDKY
jgi:hypothetical protein